MTEPEDFQDDSDPEALLDAKVNFATNIHSSVGIHLDRIMEQVGFRIELTTQDNHRHIAPHLHMVHDGMYSCDLKVGFETESIDVRQNVPAQVSAQLRRWAEELIQMADSLQAVEAALFRIEARAHELRDSETGKVLCASMFFDRIRDSLREHSEEFGSRLEVVEVSTGAGATWELRQEFREWEEASVKELKGSYFAQ